MTVNELVAKLQKLSMEGYGDISVIYEGPAAFENDVVNLVEEINVKIDRDMHKCLRHNLVIEISGSIWDEED